MSKTQTMPAHYENGVLVCTIHKTPINKYNGRFFCRKCQKTKDNIQEARK